jgi:hypothetical protein
METTIFGSVILVLVPSITTALTGLFKQLPTFESLSDSARTPAVRALAAFIALVIVLFSEWMSGSFDAGIISATVQTFFLTFGTWVASLGIFHGVFEKA